jgi:hypothetical protein
MLCYDPLMFRSAWWLLTLAALSAPTSAVYGKECTCRYFEQRIEVGAVACINGKLAQCLMFQNNPSWKFISDTCPQTHNNPKPRAPVSKAKLAAR